MIKIDSKTEALENNIDISKSYMNIKAGDSLSAKELNDLVVGEFESAHKYIDSETYNEILDEIYDRSEDELHIDFNITYDIKRVLDEFAPDNWENIDDNDRLSLIKELVEVISAKLGLEDIPNVELFWFEDENYGYYELQSNTISLNEKYLMDPIELVDTISHELRHAYQNYRAEILETHEDELFKVNLDNYINPISFGGEWLFFTDYLDQYVEVDARVFANIFKEEMKWGL